ncbi:hypothetical protein [Alteromonas flava]|uniref:hypothetical protein n=1 Tax=Alteromonas flava TaxID=2048003 RepID=UPI000C28239A|nr:hypothetical protein [Alteromonas flava]
MQIPEKRNKTREDESQYALLFSDLYQFMRASTGLSIAISYLVMILTSTAYLYTLYDAFGIDIVKFITLEDILVAPIKNPDIIVVFAFITLFFYFADSANLFSAKQRAKYADNPMPLYIKVLLFVFWAPKKRKNNLRLTFVMGVLSLGAYIWFFANNEAEDIKSGGGSKVTIVVSDSDAKTTTLLGVSSYFLFTYDETAQDAKIYSIEAVESLQYLSEKSED